MSGGSVALLVAVAVVGCGNANGQSSQSTDNRTLKLFAGTWRMQLADDEKREFKEQKIEVPSLTIREDGTWTWRFIDETRAGKVKTEEGAVVLVWEKVNDTEPSKDLTGETRGTLTASEPAELLLRCGQDEAEYLFDRETKEIGAPAEGADSGATP
ncbi:MAG: hypothetical protein KF812_06280 [Fimbriimonadaceae bacterium]|nr:hypothetical protein [Fimbriimonadaceae bacterium]